MMHQESLPWVGNGANARDASQSPVSMLAYRSRAVIPPTRADLDHILRSAQDRNRIEGVTGLLIYDQGCFFQWLEGPAQGLMRVWQSIRRDPRHVDIQILREEDMPKRFFGAWDMRLARRTRGEIDTVLSVVEAPRELLNRLRLRPAVLADDGWDRLFADVLVPRLGLRHPAPHRDTRRAAVPGPIWHASREAAAELAGLLLAVDNGDTARYVNGLIDQGAALEPLYSEVFEPAARCLGGLWDSDHSDAFNVSLAMGRLQVEARRLTTVLAREYRAIRPGHAILVAAAPGEPHGLNATLCSELFCRDGWDVSCEYPSSDKVLRDLVHDRWYDVLELSSSAAMRRDQQLNAMRLTIRTAQAASLNPALAVIVDGRTFFESPQSYLDVGADVGCRVCTEAAPAAERLLSALASHAPRQGEAEPAPSTNAPGAAAERLTRFEKRFRSTVF